MQDSSETETNDTTGDAESNGKAAFQPRLTGDLLSSSLLAFLRRWNAYGYQLVRSSEGRRPAFRPPPYIALSRAERAGLVSSFWDTSSQAQSSCTP
jgi:hypothetical protein